MTKTKITLLAFALSGCTSLPEVGEDDCQLRAGAAIGEGQAPSFGTGNLTGGAVTLINPESCDVEQLRVFTRYGQTVVCLGTAEWCAQALETQPVEMTPAQLRSLIDGDAG